MFAKSIVVSDDFLDMPATARCLYFTLGMFADDDGFVNNPKSIMRQSGSTTDDMNILIAKKYVIAFESGVIVIRHWRIHNYIKSDRYHGTVCTDEKKQLSFSGEGKVYEKTVEIPTMVPNCIQDGSKMDTEVSIGKDRLGEDSIFTPPTIEDVREYFKEKNFVIDPDFFYNYYTEGGWMSKDRKGNPVPIKNWKQKAIVWNKKELEKQPKSESRKVDWSDFMGENDE